MNKLNRHYLLLFLAFIALGPVLPALVLFGYNTTRIRDDLELLLSFGYLFGLLPALLTGALVWALGLRRDGSGIGATLLLGMGLSFLEGLIFSGNQSDPTFAGMLALYGFGSALCFCPCLPQPEATSSPLNSSPEKNHD